MLSVLFLFCVMQNIFAQQVSAQKVVFSVPEDVTNNIFLYYFKGPSFNDQIILKLEDGLSLIEQENFDVNSPTTFFYHGWSESATGGSAQEVVSAFLEKQIRNVVAFDYSALVGADLSLVSYVISVHNASVIGQAIGEFFKQYIPTKQPLNLVKMVSHSLGSQIMAKTARVYGVGQLERLTVAGQKINFTVPNKYTDQIFLYYYKGPTLNDLIGIKLENGLSVTEQKDFNVTATTVFHFPGWGENASDGSSASISSAFLQKKVCNLVVFDYSSMVRSNGNAINYVIAVYNAMYIGQAIGEFFKLYLPEKQPLNLVKMISHSLGSQIVAKASRVFGIGKFERITALDPAGPIYKIPWVAHLDASDGKFVDVIHSDAGFFGDPRNVGTVDFFPNRGTRYQPGCRHGFNFATLISDCSHRRSYLYYAESITNPKAFLAKKCRRFLLFKECCCNARDTTYMGYYVNISVHGTYYLKTNSKKPYGKGVKGIHF